jgi:hypothetical protein
MKQLFIFLFALTTAFTAYATVITVDNNPNSPGQYTGIQAAINAAVAGDSIYISGSTTNYGNFSLNKRVTIFGTGYNPLKQVPVVSIVSSMSLDTVTSVSGASNSKVYGLAFTGNISDTYGAKFVSIERCQVNGSTNMSASSANWVIRNNAHFSVININNSPNILFENNLAYGCAIQTSNQPTVTINHNVFLFNVGSGYYCANNVQNATWMNNIFWGASPIYSNVTGCVFNNNLTYQTPNDVIPGSGNTGSNNLVTVPPGFVNVPNPNSIGYGYDYNVINVSAANNAGTDGTDLGVYGGTSAMQDLSGMPAIPQMYEMNITNPTIPPAGTLNVTFKARKNN